MRIIPVSRPESKPVNILSVRYESKVSVEWFLQNQIDIYRECSQPLDIPLFGPYSLVWSYITLSVNLETIGRGEIGLKPLESVFLPFLCRGLSFASLQSFGKCDSLMDKLQIFLMGMAKHWHHLQKST